VGLKNIAPGDKKAMRGNSVHASQKFVPIVEKSPPLGNQGSGGEKGLKDAWSVIENRARGSGQKPEPSTMSARKGGSIATGSMSREEVARPEIGREGGMKVDQNKKDASRSSYPKKRAAHPDRAGGRGQAMSERKGGRSAT